MVYDILGLIPFAPRRIGGAPYWRPVPWWWHLISAVWHLLFLGIIVLAIVLIARAFSRAPAGPRFFAPPYQPAYAPPPPPPAPGDPTTTLTQAKSLLDQELISQAEYDAIRQKVLARMQGPEQPPA